MKKAAFILLGLLMFISLPLSGITESTADELSDTKLARACVIDAVKVSYIDESNGETIQGNGPFIHALCFLEEYKKDITATFTLLDDQEHEFYTTASLQCNDNAVIVTQIALPGPGTWHVRSDITYGDYHETIVSESIALENKDIVLVQYPSLQLKDYFGYIYCFINQFAYSDDDPYSYNDELTLYRDGIEINHLNVNTSGLTLNIPGGGTYTVHAHITKGGFVQDIDLGPVIVEQPIVFDSIKVEADSEWGQIFYEGIFGDTSLVNWEWYREENEGGGLALTPGTVIWKLINEDGQIVDTQDNSWTSPPGFILSSPGIYRVQVDCTFGDYTETHISEPVTLGDRIILSNIIAIADFEQNTLYVECTPHHSNIYGSMTNRNITYRLLNEEGEVLQSIAQSRRISYTFQLRNERIYTVEVIARYKGFTNTLKARVVMDDSILSTHFTLPSEIKTIDEEAFANIPMEKIIIPNGCIHIGNRAFANCGLLEIVIPESVQEIALDAFENCAGMTICGKEGSMAQYYAEEKGYSFRVQ